MGNVCLRWFCFEDPYDKQCSKMVEKNSKMVQCKRIGTHFVSFNNEYLCDKHHDVKEVAQQRVLSITRRGAKKRTSIDKAIEKAYSINSSDSSSCDSYDG